MPVLNLDHDMLVRVDENVKNLISEFKAFKIITSDHDTRLRLVEDAITKLTPIPSVSHEAVVIGLRDLNTRVDTLYTSKGEVIGGWKAITVIITLLATIAGLLYYVTRITH